MYEEKEYIHHIHALDFIYIDVFRMSVFGPIVKKKTICPNVSVLIDAPIKIITSAGWSTKIASR